MNNENLLPTHKLVSKVYFHCKEAMEYICEYPKLLFAILLNILTPVLFYGLSFPVYTEFLANRMDIADMEQVKQMAVVGLGINGLQNVFIWFFRTVLIFLAFKILKQSGTFKQLLAITGYAYLAIVPMMIIMCIANKFTGELFVNFSPAVFVPHLRGTVLYGFLRGLCLFFTWEHILIAVGVVHLTKNRKNIIIVAVVYFIQIFMNLSNLMTM